MALVMDKCLLGIEIEIEKADSLYDKRPMYWSIKEDGSLRDGGVELVFKKPYLGIFAEKAIDEAYDILLKKDMEVSPRTGIHVHIDIQDMTLRAFKALCLLYALVEEPLFQWVGNYRDSNNFCMPWYEAEGDIGLISEILQSEKENFSSKTRRVQRYAALNLNAVSKFGSVEFRHLQTTLDKDILLEWVNLLLSLKKYAVNFKLSHGKDILEKFSSLGPERFIKDIFGPLSKKLNPHCINLGLMTAHDLLYGENKKIEQMFYAHLFEKGEPEGLNKFKPKIDQINLKKRPRLRDRL